jgi:T-complex protein 1 subunit gamma
LNDALETIAQISQPVDISSETEMLALIKTSIGTKFSSRWSDLMCSLALQAVKTVAVTAEAENGLVGNATGKDSGMSSLTIKTVDLKRYARVEKVPGGEIEDCKVLQGVMINKDVTHPKMRRKIANPRIVLLDCPLEYKKGESQTNIEISKEEDWNRVLQIEEEQIKAMCEKIIEFKPDLVFTEKGVSGKSSPCPVVMTMADVCRPRTALPAQGQHHRSPSCPKVRQQPYRSSSRSYHCQPNRGSARCRRRNGMRHVPH